MYKKYRIDENVPVKIEIQCKPTITIDGVKLSCIGNVNKHPSVRTKLHFYRCKIS
jgi:hypothetical protein